MNRLSIILLLTLHTAFAGNILVLNPLSGHSHVRLLGNLADLLANDGHNVTILSVVLDSTIPPFGTKNPAIHKILYESPYLPSNPMENTDLKSDAFWDTPEMDGLTFSWSDWTHFTESFKLIYKGLLEDKALMQSLKNSKFDLGVCEIFELASMGVMEALDIKSAMIAGAVGMIPFHYEISGIPYFPSFVPDWITTYSEDMSFWERMNTIKANIDYRLQTRHDTEIYNELFREYYPNMPDLMEIAKKKTGVIFTNANEFTETPRLRSNLIQYIGGTNVHPVKPLENEISDLLNLRPKNVFLSFGTYANVCHIPLKKKEDILEAFAKFPNVTFLWKHEDCEGDQTPIEKYPNVVRKGWWPQSDLLGDPRMSAFITHAGMNSFTEAVFRGIPTITVPLFADQYINAKTSEKRGLSVMIKRTELNKETLVTALKEVLNENSEVVKKAKIAGAVMKGKDEEYRNSVLRWANLLIEFGPQEHLSLPSRNLNLLQLYSLDILGFAVITILTVVYVITYFYRLLFRSEKLKKL